MRNPSGAEDSGSEDVGVEVADGMGGTVEVGFITVRVVTGIVFTTSVGIEVTAPQAPTNAVMRIMENTINSHFDVFISNIIANSRGQYNWLKRQFFKFKRVLYY